MIRIKSYSATGSSVADHHYDSCVMLAEDMSKFCRTDVVSGSSVGRRRVQFLLCKNVYDSNQGCADNNVRKLCCADDEYEHCAVQMTSTKVVLCRWLVRKLCRADDVYDSDYIDEDEIEALLDKELKEKDGKSELTTNRQFVLKEKTVLIGTIVV